MANKIKMYIGEGVSDKLTSFSIDGLVPIVTASAATAAVTALSSYIVDNGGLVVVNDITTASLTRLYIRVGSASVGYITLNVV